MTHDNPGSVKPSTRQELATWLVGKTITHVEHTRAYGDMDGEVGNLNLHFSDGTVLSLHAVGHDPDGIGFDLK